MPGVDLVEMPGALSADLRALTDALDPPRDDLERDLHALIAATRMAGPAYLGLTLTLVAGGLPYTIVALERVVSDDEVRSSAFVPLPLLCDVEDGSSIVFYAGEVAAFVDFALDVSVALNRPLDEIVLDQHLSVPTSTRRVSRIAAATVQNQALGVLIDRGRPPAAARHELRRLADAAGTGVVDVAETIVRSTSEEPTQRP